MKVKASDPGRNSEWGRFRDKTNLRLAQGPPAVTSRRLGVRQTTGNRRNGRGGVGPWRCGLRQPATEKGGTRVVKSLLLFWSVSQGLGSERGGMGKDRHSIEFCTVV